MNHQELNALWMAQEEQWSDWRRALLVEACRLREEVATAIQLDPGAAWKNPTIEEQHRYVEVVSLAKAGERLRHPLQESSVTDDGELIFGLALTFEFGPNAFPKNSIHVPIAMRFRERKPEFAFYDAESHKVKASPPWEPDLQKFIAALLGQVEEHLSFDPFSGPHARSSIGFL